MILLYRALLHLYPKSFRQEYGDEMTAAFRARLRETEGAFALAVLPFAALGDVLPNAMAAHWDILRRDLRYSLRSLGRTPGFAFTAVLVIALGIGANTAAFSLADFVLLRPLPLPESDRLVKLWSNPPGYRSELSPVQFREWKSMSTSYEDMAAFVTWSANLQGLDEPRRIQVSRVTPEFFGLVGSRAIKGQPFGPADSAAGRLVVLSHSLWQSQFAGEPDIVGRIVRLDDQPYVVSAVMPPSFTFPNDEVAAWAMLTFTPADLQDRGNNFLAGIARLRRGVSAEQADVELDAIAARLEQQFPSDDPATRAMVIRLRDELPRSSKMLIITLCGASLCILLLTCANLASLLLARAVSREREIAVRTALGAGRDRLVRQLITESVVLALVGGTVGVLAAIGSLPLLAALVPHALPVSGAPSIDGRILAFAAALVSITGIAFGIVPALRMGRVGALSALRTGTRSASARTQRARSVLVTVEVMASVVLVIGAGLLIRAMLTVQAVDPGFRPDGVLTARTALPLPRYDTTAKRVQFYRSVLDGMRALPGTTDAAYTTGLPMATTGMIWPVRVEGDTSSNFGSKRSSLRFVSPQYFATLRIPLRGRDFEERDDNARQLVAIVSESFAKRYWPKEDAIGKRFTLADSVRTVVGVAGDVRVRGRIQTSEPQMYIPYGQVPDGAIVGYTPKDLVVRSSAPVATITAAIRQIVRDADPTQPVSDIRSMSAIVGEEIAPRVSQLRVLAALAAIALLIAAVGIHGLLSFMVNNRTAEIGVRRALGAQSGALVRMVMRDGLRYALVGAVLGVIAAYWAGRGMGALLLGVRPDDPAVIITAIVLCCTTTVLGCLAPALRAGRVDPMVAMRGE